jgi:hypothetical protein
MPLSMINVSGAFVFQYGFFWRHNNGQFVFIRGDKVDNFFCNIFIHYVSRIFIKEFWVYEWYLRANSTWALDEDNRSSSGKNSE